jgi:hypothetical protein
MRRLPKITYSGRPAPCEYHDARAKGDYGGPDVRPWYQRAWAWIRGIFAR